MEFEQYNNIHNYLLTHQYPDNFTSPQKQKLEKQSSNYIVKNNYLYKKDKRKENNLLRVIRKHEMEPVLFIFHNDPTAAHFAVDAMFEKIRTRYYWPKCTKILERMLDLVIVAKEEARIRKIKPYTLFQ